MRANRSEPDASNGGGDMVSITCDMAGIRGFRQSVWSGLVNYRESRSVCVTGKRVTAEPAEIGRKRPTRPDPPRDPSEFIRFPSETFTQPKNSEQVASILHMSINYWSGYFGCGLAWVGVIDEE